VDPRHIEVQVFGDGRGGGVHLYERECSLQRRHQKVWEEAPAPHLKDKTRDGLFTAALNLVRGIKYRSAGTCEFLVDSEENFYFLEMNTRLQVEHPVTEGVTGVDLVHLQIELALERGKPGRLEKEFFTKTLDPPRGHAIEVRIYAEDAAQGFMPTPGQVLDLKWPMGPGIRVDSGIEMGQNVGTQFDSMLAKLIVWAPTRAQAVARLRFALDETVILGMGTNQAYLQAIAKHPSVVEGLTDTGFLMREFGDFTNEPNEESLKILAHAVSAGLHQSGAQTGGASGSQREGFPSPWRLTERAGR